MSHTPGPWTLTWLYDASRTVAMLRSSWLTDGRNVNADHDWKGTATDATLEANAHLIAAAPELLTALKETLAYWDSCGFSDCDEGCECIVQSVQVAIAKAEGRTPCSDG